MVTEPTRRERRVEAGGIGARGARDRLLFGLPIEERRLSLGGVSTTVLEGGSGDPLVLLHGPGEHATKWMRVLPSLVTSHRVVAPDLPAHGESLVSSGSLELHDVLAWLDELVERTCTTPPVLCGQIMGGAIAARYAAERGERLRALVLVDALGLAPFQPAPEFGGALMEFVSRPNEDTHDALWRRCAFDLDTLRDELGDRWEALKAYNLDRARTPALGPHQQRLMELFGLPAIPTATLERISIPTTLIWGRQDLATPLEVAKSTSQKYGWPLHVIERCADDPPIEQPEAFLKALRGALTTVSAGARGEHGETHSASEDTRAEWDRIAPGYDRTNTATQMWLGAEALRRADLRAGMRFLDVAAGSGALSIPAARVGAQVLATDQSPVMLDLLAARAKQERLTVDTRAMDGHALDLPSDSFDVAGSQFGVMLFPDMPRGIREMARIVKPGGRVLMIVYGEPHKLDFFGFLLRGLQSVRPDFSGPPMDPPPLPFQLREASKLRRELTSAGLRNVVVQTLTETTKFASGRELWEWILWSNPIVEAVLEELQLTSGERAKVEHSLDVQVRERAHGNGGAELGNEVHIGIGTK